MATFRNDYDRTQIMKLQQRHQALLEKKRELEDSVRNHQYMKK